MRSPLWAILPVLAIAAVAAGCGSSDTASTGSGTPTPLIGQATNTASSSATARATGNTDGTPTAPPGTQTQPPGSLASNCPSVSTVNSTLGITNDLGPDVSPYHQGIQCLYSASTSLASPIPQVWVYFEPATAASFTTSENGVVNAGLGTRVEGLGDDAFMIPGEIDVRKGSTKIEVVSPLSIPNPNGKEALKNLAQTVVTSLG